MVGKCTVDHPKYVAVLIYLAKLVFTIKVVLMFYIKFYADMLFICLMY